MKLKQFAILSCLVLTQISLANETFTSLYNGNDLSGWTVKVHGHPTGDNFAGTFKAQGDRIVVDYTDYPRFNNRFAHLYTNKTYQNFHLILEYRFLSGFMSDAPSYAKLNSGVMFVSQSPESMPPQQNWPVSVEMQFLADDPANPGRTTGNMCSPGTDVVYNNKLFTEHCLRSSYPAVPAGKWVKAELIVKDGVVKQIINGQTVLEYKNPTINIGKLIKGYNASLFKNKQSQRLTRGHIALQSEGHPIEFRNIMIAEL
ncbi:3-keto-disaccharide hydrolase [Catenovulum sediminis]|uniref:3-keto-disaccharide hydrolase n=1 Tax=Catenovulum sediminis TaxID=1740262 RepID=UPI00117C2A27|nr:DUF1080 domain-containing protein [Catenovulum sediminis]